MQVQLLRFGALVPPEGFRWVFREDDGRWRRQDPPDEWPEQDLAAARFYEDDKPEPLLSNRYFLAASADECLRAHADQRTDFGHLIEEPDLYLRFASESPTPAKIHEYANRYGLLRYDVNEALRIKRSEGKGLLSDFRFDLPARPKNLLYVHAEPASKWMSAFEHAAFNLRAWSELQEEGPKALASYLDDGFNYAMGGSLTFQVKMDPSTGETHTEIIASSLEQLLDVQWGMSVAANVVHRQCAECPNWFGVHPGEGRPEKVYCSDACRMRAYRKRKLTTAKKPKRAAKRRADNGARRDGGRTS